MRTMFVLPCLLLVIGCGRPAIPLITSPDDLESHVGQIVTVRGEFSNGPPPQLVDLVLVATSHPEIPEHEGQATGLLVRMIVKKQDYDINLGAGTYYWLEDESGNMASVHFRTFSKYW